jgi:hypothetical protein
VEGYLGLNFSLTGVIPKFVSTWPRRGLILVENGFLIFDGPRRGLTLVNLIHKNVYVGPLRGLFALS